MGNLTNLRAEAPSCTPFSCWPAAVAVLLASCSRLARVRASPLPFLHNGRLHLVRALAIPILTTIFGVDRLQKAIAARPPVR